MSKIKERIEDITRRMLYDPLIQGDADLIIEPSLFAKLRKEVYTDPQYTVHVSDEYGGKFLRGPIGTRFFVGDSRMRGAFALRPHGTVKPYDPNAKYVTKIDYAPCTDMGGMTLEPEPNLFTVKFLDMSGHGRAARALYHREISAVEITHAELLERMQTTRG